jgi:hypothetical protein
VKRAEKIWLSTVAQHGCVICGDDAEVHHIRTGQGMGQRASNYLVVPLCPFHHRNGGKFSRHGGGDKFKMANGSDLDLLAEFLRQHWEGRDE